MSPTLMAILQSAERQTVLDAAFCRRWYRKTGMPQRQVFHYGARRNWPDAHHHASLALAFVPFLPS